MKCDFCGENTAEFQQVMLLPPPKDTQQIQESRFGMIYASSLAMQCPTCTKNGVTVTLHLQDMRKVRESNLTEAQIKDILAEKVADGEINRMRNEWAVNSPNPVPVAPKKK